MKTNYPLTESRKTRMTLNCTVTHQKREKDGKCRSKDMEKYFPRNVKVPNYEKQQKTAVVVAVVAATFADATFVDACSDETLVPYP